MSANVLAECLHCRSPVPAESGLESFCCKGCQAVYGLLHEEGLNRWYELAGDAAAPVAETPRGRSFAWLDPLLERAEGSGAPICNLEVDVQGIHCAACVWLMNELFRREEGGAALTVNPALGKVRIAWHRGRFDLRHFLEGIERFGYLFGPSRKKSEDQSKSLLLRLGITTSLSMNVMMFSVAFYLGLAPEEEEIFRLFTNLSAGLSAAVVAIGGWPFFKAAWQGLRRGVLHLDLPIAMGILLAFGASFWQAREGRGDLLYFDTLNVFVTLMLVGRWLQQRVLDRNRRFLLEDDGAAGILVRRREGEALVTIPAPKVAAGDHLVIAPGDLLPVDAQLLDAGGAFSLDWITGESEVREFGRAEVVPAGAFHSGRRALEVIARTSFDESPLPGLLRAEVQEESGRVPAHARFWDRWARIYVLAVIAIALFGFAVWAPHDPQKALQVTVALLVVTCPCAIGIALPLAYELVQARLRRIGLFARKRELLDKLPRVRKLLFDKTGTLTLGRLRLADPVAVRALDPSLRAPLWNMAARSNHPSSRAIVEELSKDAPPLDPDAEVEEVPGMGLELRSGGRVYRLGRPSWAAPEGEEHAATVFSVDGVTAAIFRTRESVRVDARRELAALRDDGYELWLISGDAPAKAAAMAAELGIDAKRALGGQRPEEKAEAVARIDEEDTLYLGDGVNDSLAFERALCAGTPAIDRPVLPGKADFFLLGEGIGGIRQALAAAKELQWVVRRNVVIALAYNVLSIGLSLSGWMTPLRAAVFMPVSSLTVILLTVASLSGRRRKEAEARAEIAEVVA